MPPANLRRAAMALACLVIAGAAPPPGAAWFDIRRYVFVPGAGAPVTSVIDTDSNRIIGTLQIGVVARQVEVSRELTKLVATDASTPALTVMDVTDGIARRIALPAPAQRLVLGGTGRLLAAFDPGGGSITLVDLVNDRVAASIVGLPKLRDVMFGDKDILLYIAAEGLGGIGVIDVAGARLTGEIAPFRPAPAGIAGLARTPNGRSVLARPQGGGPISVIDADQGAAVSQIAAGSDPAGIFPSGTGIYLLLPDNAQATLAVFRSGTLLDPVVLKGAAGVTGVYTAWLDSVAFAPSAARRSVFVYDLDTMRLADEIGLYGTPTRAAVTADSRTLYVPLLDPPQVKVIDGETRRIIATINLPGTPLAAIVAGGWGICH
jgi:DNA-binding beta-propeller fold protein YncE